MINYHHRLATQTDLAAIVAIYNSTIASREVTADTEPVSIESRQTWFDQHNATTRPIWIVEAAQSTTLASTLPTILGWMSFSDFHSRPAYAGTAEISIYIHEDARGKGLGRYLIEQAIAYAPHVGIHSLVGLIFGHNAPSLQLFNAFGFERWADMPRVAVLDGVERDLIILGKHVN